LGVEINVDYTAACVIDMTGTVRCYEYRPLDNRGMSSFEVLGHASSLVRAVRSGFEQPLLGAGLALPGVVSPDGELLRAPNLPRLTGARPGDLIGETLGSGTVLVDNEANLGALALLWSGASESGNVQDFVYVSGEVGVGAGIVVAGELFRGVNGFAGELGHVVVDRNGPPCGCGGQGCVEQYAGQDILLRTARAADIHALQEKIDLGDPLAVRAVEQAGSALGVGLASLLNLLDVPLVVLGGMYARLFDAIRPPLLAELGRRVLSVGDGGNDLLVRSPQGIDAAVRGAAGLVVHEAIKDPTRLASADVV
jgi:predicted NBD/HSP70 family sugar kinase